MAEMKLACNLDASREDVDAPYASIWDCTFLEFASEAECTAYVSYDRVPSAIIRASLAAILAQVYCVFLQRDVVGFGYGSYYVSS